MTRDMTRTQFVAALKRNGFKHAALFWFKDTTGQAPDTLFSGLFLPNGKMLRRSTISRLIQSRKEQVAENKKKQRAKA